MTVHQLAKRIRFWQNKLEYLGIRHWDITVRIVDRPNESDSCDACIHTSHQYDSATADFKESFLENNEVEQIDQVIIHELLHLVLRDFDNAIDAAGRNMGMSERMLWDDSLDREREGVVERLARTIWVLYYDK
jgi:hypothetical protein